MKKIIINLLVLSALGSSACAMEDNLKVLKNWFFEKTGECSESFGIDGKVGQAAVGWLFGSLTGKDDMYTHMRDIKTAREYGAISDMTMKKLRDKCLDSLPDGVISRIQDAWYVKAHSNEPCDFNTYINGYIKAAKVKKMSAKKYLIKLYGTKSEKFWNGVW